MTGFTLGPPDGATLGPPDGGTLGALPAGRYRLELRAPGGGVRQLEAVTSIDINLEHSALSDFKAVVPADRSLEKERFSEVYVYYGASQLFHGRLEQVETDEGNVETSLSGRGVGHELEGSDLTIRFEDTPVHEAIREVWDRHTPFIATVVGRDPAEEDVPTIEGQTYEGSVAEVLVDLHERGRMRFSIDHQAPDYRVQSYPPDRFVRRASWTALSRQRKIDVSSYANRVTVAGGVKDNGMRARDEAVDQGEIDAKDRQITHSIFDPSIESDADARSLAESELAERIAEDQLSGSIEIVPAHVLPGFRYRIGAWDAELPLESVSYSDSRGDDSGSLDFGEGDALVERLKNIQRDQRKYNRDQQGRFQEEGS